MSHTFLIRSPYPIARMKSFYQVFPIFVLLSLALAGESYARAGLTDEDYWKAVWPNTAIPDPLQDLLKATPPGTENLPMKINDTQYPIGFFFNHEIYPGKTMTVQFSMRRFTQGYGLLPWDQGELKDVETEEYEGYSREELCVHKGPSIEDKYCAQSLGTLMDYVISKLGKNVKPLLSSFVSKQEQYRVEGVTNIGEKAVMCHRLNFQKATFYCHNVHATTAYTVPLVAGDGIKTQALAVCHFDTSGINKKWIRSIMKVDPGTNPVCHFLGSKEILWIPY